MSNEMGPYFIGPLAPQVFLDKFLPLSSPGPSVPSFEPGMFSALSGASSEADMYDKFVRSESSSPSLGLIRTLQVGIMNPSLENLTIFNTSHAQDTTSTKFSFTCQPDCSAYLGPRDEPHSFIEFPIEFKTKSEQDPFVTALKMPDHDETTTENPFLNTTTAGREVAGQITAYTSFILGSQYRTHMFLVLIFKKFARLIRWDRGGAVVTERIKYDTQPHLFDFFIRYDNTNRAIRGHDTTVAFSTLEEDRAARKLEDFAEAKSRLLTVTIPDPHQPRELHRYVICAPCARPDIPAGRWTRVSIAYDVRRKKRVLLKDSWRVLLDDILPEGDVYTMLHQKSVPNVPHCWPFGDVGDDTYHTSRTHEFVGICGEPLSRRFMPHRHHRLVLHTIGRKLQDFNRSWEMVNAVHAALLGELTDR